MKIIKVGGRECFTDLPLHVNWPLTRKCNYRCSYCFHYGKGKNPPPQLPFSTLEQLRNAVDNIASLNRPWYNIGFGGGEPTIHPHLFDIISMLHETLEERLAWISIPTNGSRNEALYKKIADISKVLDINMLISIHTEYVDMSHVLELVKNLSSRINIRLALMFNPDQREFVHEIYDTLFDYRKRFWFDMSIDILRDEDIVDPRYIQEDFAWHKEATNKYNNLVQSLSSQFPARRKPKYRNPVMRTIENSGDIKTVKVGNRMVDLANGLWDLKGMYCIANSSVLYINVDGTCRGMICGDDKTTYNVYNKNCFQAIRDKLIHPVKCTRRVCGCYSNDVIPRFASEKDAKKYVRFAQKRQAELFSEYDAAHSFKII